MIIYPSIDLRQGQVVRLREGDPNQQITFSSDPLTTARQWIDAGAQWLHVVNLDGAFDQDSPNLQIAADIVKLGVPVQYGGGVRSLDHVRSALAMGVRRVVLGTAAVERPDVVISAVQEYGSDAVCVGLDARDGQIATHGWKTASGMTPAALGLEMARHGVRHALFTDVSRDGRMEGVNREATVALAVETGLHVIASGGVSSLDDLRALADSGVVAGAVVGMALYLGTFTLPQAIAAAQPSQEH